MSPSSGSQHSSGSKRATLEIFSQLRYAEDLSEKYRATEEEFDTMLDQNLFREIAESPRNHNLLKQFHIASDVANDLLDDAEDDMLMAKNTLNRTPSL